MITPAGTLRFYYYDEKDMLELTEYARGMGREEYEDLREKVVEESKKFYTSTVWNQIKEVAGKRLSSVT